MAAPIISSMDEATEQLQMLLNGPAGKPPPGIRPNFVDPPSLNAISTAMNIFEMILVTLVVFMRMYTKLYITRSTCYEDYMIIGAWIGQIAFCGVSVRTMQHHGGTHMWDVQLKEFFLLLYWVNVSAIVYNVTVMFIKLSILLQYLRIFVPIPKEDRLLFMSIHVTMWSSFVFYITTMMFVVTICSPRKKIWNPLLTTGRCYNYNAVYIAIGIFNVVSDIVILIIPMFPIWKLPLPIKTRIGVMAVFAAGLLACVTSILRTSYNFRIAQSRDVSYNILVLGLFTWAETTIGILIACLPVLPRFFRHFGSKVCGAFSRSKPIHDLNGDDHNDNESFQMGTRLSVGKPPARSDSLSWRDSAMNLERPDRPKIGKVLDVNNP